MTASSHFVQVDGVRWHVKLAGQGEPLLLLHGFTGSSESMAELASGLVDDHRVICIDLPGHGKSDAPSSPEAYRMEHCVAGVVACLDALSVEAVDVIGYSMGGRTALALCVWHPQRVRSAILVGASAGLRSQGARAARREADERLAQRIECEGLPAFVDYWMGLPLFASQRRLGKAALARAREQRLGNSVQGLAGSLRGMGTGSQPALHEALPRLQVPILLAVGEEDEKFRAIATELSMSLPRGQIAQISKAGHACHLENPSKFLQVARRFLLEREGINPTRERFGMKSVNWKTLHDYQDIRFEGCDEGIAKITIARPEVRNAFRPRTLFELIDAFTRAREDDKIGVILFTGEGPHAFCSGGDQKVRGDSGYVGDDGVPRLNALDLQRVIRSLPKPVIALVAGYAIGGGHVLHLICDLTIAADNARFGQTGPRVGSFDAGFGASYMARVVGQKKAREIWYLCRQYDAEKALEMGLVNEVVPLEDLEATGVAWAQEILRHSPIAIRCLKAAFNADCDGQAGIQELAGNATMLFYMSEEAQEGRDAFVEKREPDFSRFPWRP